jgi:pilus assembly protein CpaC
VAPEVSQLDSRQGVTIAGVVIPGLSTRRVSTTVELRDGESFAIAGLFQQDYQNNVRQIPWVSELPVLGALFRSTRWRRQETELVVIVTPRMITPATSLAASPAPLQGGVEPSFASTVLAGAVLDKPLAKPVDAAGQAQAGGK